jgi:PTH1 family peptidyl-tRNA hydrolase
MKLIVGLGNPGPEYSKTKHNAGFAVIEALARASGIKINVSRHSSLIGRGRIKDEEVLLALPQTYMNLSGEAVDDLVKEEIRSLDDMIVVCDDINLKLGRIRIRKKGSSGGHKGLESIIRFLGNDSFARLRVGIATDVHKGDITNYVLSPFRRSQARNASHALALAKDAVSFWITSDTETTMAKFNKRKAGTS